MVGFENVYTVTEPEAAALAWQNKVGSSLSSDVVVILDCGGGTADWACLKQRDGKLRLFSELPPGGDESLGGHDVDTQLFELIQGRLEDEDNDDALEILKDKDQEVLFQLKTIKERYSKRGSLSTSLRTVRLGTTKVELSEEELQEMFEARIIANLVTNFSQYLNKVKSQTGTENPIVLLVGGTGQLKGLKEGIQERCGVEVVWWMESEFATVQGGLYGVETEEEPSKAEDVPRQEEAISPGIRREDWTGSMEQFDALDTDGDGVLSQVELMQLIQLNQKEEVRKAEEKRLAQEALQRQEAKRLEEEKRIASENRQEEEEKKRQSLLSEAVDLQKRAEKLGLTLSPVPNSSQEILSWMTESAILISKVLNKQKQEQQRAEEERLREEKRKEAAEQKSLAADQQSKGEQKHSESEPEVKPTSFVPHMELVECIQCGDRFQFRRKENKVYTLPCPFCAHIMKV